MAGQRSQTSLPVAGECLAKPGRGLSRGSKMVRSLAPWLRVGKVRDAWCFFIESQGSSAQF